MSSPEPPVAVPHKDVLTLDNETAAVYAPHPVRDDLVDAFDDDPQHGIGTPGDPAAASLSWAMLGAAPAPQDAAIRALVASYYAKAAS
mmetsp:Transcript_12586/g.39158  ORF Transcript_12586/g.39158 Transcript_12586/m.39158 type:complete len:88 (+) Transcript_12586:29-292(+)|eukprot:CAMPEP_0174853608 /NCGR_PEP_ID=MMETSP1114-20130205/29117_1 /TAXON_ID=312471 /ORGANISM="Neobodo designis, Strain CCAP 1951/1" /LENGTH=87 /DNA_ID=CAMNT_0016088263 /DNA_START=27 /DNA_END=290 /DNA_ORIENTATION=+